MRSLEFDHPHARGMLDFYLVPYIKEARPRIVLDLEHDNRWRIEHLVKPNNVSNYIAPELPAEHTLSTLVRGREHQGVYDFILAVGMFERIWNAKEGFKQLKYLLDEHKGRLIIVYRDYDAMMAMYASEQAEIFRHSDRTTIRIGCGGAENYVTARRQEVMGSLARETGFEILTHESIRVPYWVADSDPDYKKGDTYFHLMALRCL